MKKFLFVVAWLVTSTCVSADPISDVVDSSGMADALVSVETQLISGFRQGLLQTPADAVTQHEMMVELEAQFGTGAFRSHVQSKIGTVLQPDDAGVLLEWYGTDLGRRITELETDATRPDQIQKMLGDMKTLTQDQDRMAQAARMDDLLGATDQNIEMARASQTAILIGMLGEDGARRFLAQMDQALMQSRSNMARMVQASMVFMYHDLSSAELERYITFLAEPAARRFYQAAQVGLIEYVARSFEQVGAMLRKKLEMPVALQEHAAVHH